MDRRAVIDTLQNIIGDYLKIQRLDLIDLIYRYEGKDLILRVLVDRPEGGITLYECAQINKEISQILDAKDILRMRYVLEVSSPGLDRLLITREDFSRCINRRVRFFLAEPIDGRVETEGVITKVEGDLVHVDIEDKIIEILLSKINRGKQLIGGI